MCWQNEDLSVHLNEPKSVVMFRLRCVNPCLRRLLHGRTVIRDQVLEQLQVCSAEDQVFDLVGKNKAKLTVKHVGCAVGMLWQFQKEKPHTLRTVELTKSHQQFLTLRVLAENKIGLMDDFMLVDMLYSFLRYIKMQCFSYVFKMIKIMIYLYIKYDNPLLSFRLNVDPHDSLVQQLVSEAWLRIGRYDCIIFVFM